MAIESETGETGVLFANFTIQNLQDTLRNTATSRVVGVVDGDFEFLSQIGIRTLSDGTLSTDDGDLTDALAADGTDSEGLNFRISSLTDGSYGFITLSIGVAQITNRVLENLTDASLEGPLEAEIDAATASIKDFDETISDLEGRLVLFEEDLRERFTNLEVILGRLNSQRDVFAQSIEGLQALFRNS